MSIFALLALIIAFVLACVRPPAWWLVPALIAVGIFLALVVTTGTMVSLH